MLIKIEAKGRKIHNGNENAFLLTEVRKFDENSTNQIKKWKFIEVPFTEINLFHWLNIYLLNKIHLDIRLSICLRIRNTEVPRTETR